MKTIMIRIPKRIPARPLDYRDCAPVGDPWSRRNTFIILHEWGYRWRPRLKRWDVPKVPARKYKVKVIKETSNA
jgi:hypothetical protein